jgi:hypothetical protein
MEDNDRISRRRFIGSLAGGAALAGIGTALDPLRVLSSGADHTTAMPVRPLGNTGHAVRLFSLGGQATLEQSGTDEEAGAIINRAIDLGVNYIDTAAAYGDGTSETYIGRVMKHRRKEVFLATKTHRRSYDESMRLLERSLKNLQTDHLDLWQLHNVRTGEDIERMFAKGGAVEALEKAREQKLVRFLGITGHYDPQILRTAIERYPFDTILMALNAADRHRKSFIDHLLPSAVQRNMGIIGMKIPARGRLFREGGITTMETAMRYVLTLQVSTVIVGISTVRELEENIAIAERFLPMSDEEMKETEELTRPYFADASWFKTSW